MTTLSGTLPPMIAATSGVVVGEVIEVKTHPHGDRIRVADVDCGGEKLQIVFGGLMDDIHAGSLVPVARPGARVPTRKKKMRTRRFRGVLSRGMLCSLVELGWAQSCPDEVALLRDVKPGDCLDKLSEARREEIVLNEGLPDEAIVWRRACDGDDLLEPDASR